MTDTQKWQLLALTVVLSAFLYLLAPVLTPFAAAALFAYLGDPLVDRLQTCRLSRTAAVAVVFALMTLAVVSVVLLLIPMLQKQIVHFGERFPVYLAWFETVALPWLEQQSGFDLDRLQVGNLLGMVKQYWQQAGSAAATVFGGLSRSGMAVLEFVANLTLIPVVTFYLLRDWDGMVARIRELLPRAIEPTVVRLANESDAVLGSFLRGQVSVMLALGTIYTLGLSLIGIDLALLIGMLAGLVSFVPYLGVIVGFGAGLIAALVQHGDLFHVLLVAGVFGFGQIIEGFVLTPWLVGDKIGMHPVAVIFAIMAGGQLFGFLGVLLALPVAAVIMVVLRWLHERYTQSSLYGAAERAVEDALIHEVARADVAPSALTASDAPQDAADKPPIANA